jgi:SAM-dependent methyltransferase
MTIAIPAEADAFVEAERVLEQEWVDQQPLADADIARFYEYSVAQQAQLEAWHEQNDSRKLWTEMIVNVAQRSGQDGGEASVVIDIGAGTGRDLCALRDAGIEHLYGVEPNILQRGLMQAAGFGVVADIKLVDNAAWDYADLILCMDVLEHIPEPDLFLESWCSKPPIGATLIERTPVWDVSTVLHRNRGWSPGHTLDLHGWKLIEQDRTVGIGIWKRVAEHAPLHRAGIVQVLYDGVGPACYNGMLELVASGWKLPYLISGDGLIPRGRSMAFSHWWRDTADDVCVMIDADIGFAPSDVERLAYWCRNGYPVVCAAFPLRDGSAIGVRTLPNDDRRIQFGDDLEPQEVMSIAPGFLAVHRRVLDALIPKMQLVHESLQTSFWPLCLEELETIDRISPNGWPLEPIHAMLSEDWAFSTRVSKLGIKQYVARDIVVSHNGSLPVSIRNMGLVQEAIRRA